MLTVLPIDKYYSKTSLKRHSKIDKTKVLMANGSLMKVESIAECSKRPRSILFVLFVLLLCVPSQQLWSLRDGQFT